MRKSGPPTVPSDKAPPLSGLGIAMAPGWLPLFGHSLWLQRRPLRFLESLSAHGDILRFRIGARESLVVCDPELTAQMLRNDRVFDKQGGFNPAQREFSGAQLVTYSYNEHREPRRIVQPAFHANRMEGYAALMNDAIDSVLNSWRDSQTLDMQAEMYAITINVIFSTLMGVKPSGETVSHLVDDLRRKNASLRARVFVPDWLAWTRRLPTPANRAYRYAIARSRRLAAELFGDMSVDAQPGTMAAMLVESRDSLPQRAVAGRSLTDYAVQLNLGTFVFAGSDTTANTIVWALHLLAKHRDVLERVRAELDAVLAGRRATVADIPQLALTSNVFTETLRLYPTTWIGNRMTTTDARLGSYHIPAGTTIFWSPYVIHRRADLYPEPTRFDPDRWDRSSTRRPLSGDYVPFSIGPRKCIGDNFARIESILALAAILARWDLAPVDESAVYAQAGSLLTPENVWMRVTARDTLKADA